MTGPRKAISQGVRFNVLRRDNFACRYCGRASPEVELHLDHVRPHSQGGAATEDNLVTSCADCNVGKGAKTGIEAPVLPVERAQGGLVGWFGHTIQDDGQIQFQFEIIKELSSGSYAIQLFSWMSGSATEIQVWPASRFEKPDLRLYSSQGEWLRAAEKSTRRDRS